MPTAHYNFSQNKEFIMATYTHLPEGYSVSVSEFLKSITSRIDYDPPYQREINAWSPPKKVKLISDMIQMQAPLQKFYLHADAHKNFKYSIIDGKQRLTTILDFFDLGVNKKFSVDLEGAFYDHKNLPKQHLEVLLNTKLTFEVLEGTEAEARFLFISLQNGKPLSKVDIRHAFGGDLCLNMIFLSQRFGSNKKMHLGSYFGNNMMGGRKHEYYCGILYRALASYYDRNTKMIVPSISKVNQFRWDVSDAALDAEYIWYSTNLNKKVNRWLLFQFKNIMAKMDDALIGYYKKSLNVTIIKGLWLLIAHLDEYYTYNSKQVIRFVADEASSILQNYNNDPTNPYMIKEFEDTFRPVKYKESLYWTNNLEKGWDIFRKHFINSLVQSNLIVEKSGINSPSFSPDQKQEILAKDLIDGQIHCRNCGNVILNGDYHCDHYIPRNLSGKTVVSNGQILCPRCNCEKQDKLKNS
jgi:hypothetical protein